MIRPRVLAVETGESVGTTRCRAVRRRRLIAVLGVATATALAGCSADEPALTMVFTRVPAVPGAITVTLASGGVTFVGDDTAMPGGVSVSYVAGTIVVTIERTYLDSRSDRVRLPLKAGQQLPLMGTARISDGTTTYAAVAEATIEPGRSATLTFDFGGGDGDSHDASSDMAVSNKIAPPDAATEVMPEAGAGDRPDASPDGGPDVAPDPVDAPVDVPADAPVDVPADAPVDVPADVPVDVPADVPVDVPDKSLDASPPDVSTGDAPPSIATTCVVGGLHAASVSTATGSPTVAASTTGVFGVAWLGPGAANVLYNAVDTSGMLQNAADVPVVANVTPRLASLGTDLVLAYGRRGSAGARAAAVRIVARTGAVTGAEIVGANVTPATAPPDVGGIAASADGTHIAVISRRADLAAGTPTGVDLFSGSPALITSSAPGVLPMTRAAGVAWHPAGRFLAGVVLDATTGGGRIYELADGDLGPGRTLPFTAAPDLPVVGSGAATVAVAAVGRGIAVAWLDAQSCAGCTAREVFLATLDSNGNRVGEVQVSAPSSATKSYPHLVFDGAAITVAWLEYSGLPDAQIKLRRFNGAGVPVAPAMNIGVRGTAALGDLGLAAAGIGDYGIAYGLSSGTQTLAHVTCTGN